jgi:hypothetical protein
MCPGRETSRHCFSCSGVPGSVYIKALQDTYAILVFLRWVESADHVVHFGVSGP